MLEPCKASMDTFQIATKKRKTIDDFFVSSIPAKIRKSTTDAQHLTSTTTTVPGVSILASFITPVEEDAILTFLATQSWRTDLSRRTMHYGGTYCVMPPRDASPMTRKRIESDIITAPAIATELTFLIDRMVALNLYKPDQRPEYIIVNEYLPGHGISAHVENFRFDEPVCALTLGDRDHLRFHELVEENDGSVRSGKARQAKRTGRKVDVWLPSRSLLVMRGEARWKWQHEIVRGRKKHEGFKRTSLTFRVEKRGRDGRAKSRQ